VAATSGSNSAASLELATGGEPVMAIGGFSGQGGHLSLKAFEGYVAKGEIHYYIAGGGGGWRLHHSRHNRLGGESLQERNHRRADRLQPHCTYRVLTQ
jgi:hypothetical protein